VVVQNSEELRGIRERWAAYPRSAAYRTTPIINGLIAELKTYKRIADAHDNANQDGWVFWRRNHISLPLWYKVAAEVALVMCSSASVERVFSLLNCMFDEHQHQALNDYKEASIKIMYNENYRQGKQY
jgi:hAT family C-terminal dimerisation region